MTDHGALIFAALLQTGGDIISQTTRFQNPPSNSNRKQDAMHDLDYHVMGRPEPADEATIEFGLDAANLETVSAVREPASIIVRAMDSVMAGVIGYTLGGTLIIKSLWVDNAFRSQGVARRLMDMIEAEAQGRGCKTAFIDTMSYQSPDFYRKIGYMEEARIVGFHDEHDRIFLKKNL